jgi:O-acetylhomoserine/O-acetylserine sulfhydrylase-like pyridoxal-dependent enzyme
MAEPPVRRPPAAGASPSGTQPTGFATRAIRAAHRLPVVDQAPTSVPIYQTVTFSSADAEELGAVTTRQVPGYSYGRLDNPTVHAYASASRSSRAPRRACVRPDGRDPVAIGTLVSAGDRVVASRSTYGTTRSQLASVFTRRRRRTSST